VTLALVLGATGFLGGQIAREALRRGWRVRGLRRREGAVGDLEGEAVEWVHADLDGPNGLDAVFDGVDIVFHAAGYYPAAERTPSAVARGVAQTRRVLAACRRAHPARIVYTSTLSTIGRPPANENRLADERDVYVPGSLPRSAYYESKFAMESEVLRAAANGVPALVLNPTAVFGPGDVHLTLARALLAAARGTIPFWFQATLNVVDVRDVAAAHVRAAEVGRLGERTLLGGHNLALRELLERATRLAGRRPPRWEIPLGLVEAVGTAASRIPGMVGGSGHLQAVRTWQGYDTSKARRELGLTPRPLEETLSDALEWLQQHGHAWRP
jgi:dihydroflavonol-4-reductase